VLKEAFLRLPEILRIRTWSCVVIYCLVYSYGLVWSYIVLGQIVATRCPQATGGRLPMSLECEAGIPPLVAPFLDDRVAQSFPNRRSN
jgi:hypothetical protein